MSWSPIIAACARLAAGGGEGALATVARRRGSLPMSATAKMLVTSEGARLGTVGGGELEAEVIERAAIVAARRTPAMTVHTLTSTLAGDYGLSCGGTATMLIEPVFAEPTLEIVYTAVARSLAHGERTIVATSCDWSRGVAKVLVRDGSVIGAGVTLAAAAALLDPLAEEPLLSGDVLVEPVMGPPRLVVFGAGHVGACIAEAASLAGWCVTVIDDRPEFADPARLPFAERVVVADYDTIPADAGIGRGTYVVIATRGHRHDVTILEQVVRSDARYIGMVGSRRKAILARRVLAECGISDEQMMRLHAPVGLAIGADTPAEIAISVVAEMIAVRRATSRRHAGTSRANAESGRDVPHDPMTGE